MDWIQVLGPSVLVIIGGIVSWLLKARSDELQAVREALRTDQRQVYEEILEPYIKIFAGRNNPSQTEKAMKQVQTFDYRKTAFQLTLIGSDEVVKAYNNLMQYTFKLGSAPGGSPAGGEMIKLWGSLLLEIRKSLGNKKTSLTNIDMFRGMITDIERLAGDA